MALLARNTQAGLLDEAEIHALERVRLDQRVPEVRGIPEPPCSGGILGDAALPQVLACDLALVHLAQRRPARRAPRFLRVRRGEIDARLVRQLLDCVAEAAPFHLHDELDRIAGDAAAEAVEHLLVRDDVEAGCLLAVERAEPLPVVAALLERHAPLHHRNQIHPVAQLLQFLVRDARQMSRRQGHLSATYRASTRRSSPSRSRACPLRARRSSASMPSSPRPCPWAPAHPTQRQILAPARRAPHRSTG